VNQYGSKTTVYNGKNQCVETTCSDNCSIFGQNDYQYYCTGSFPTDGGC
jgi:hypothetical protein